jgi:hypothetical protein
MDGFDTYLLLLPMLLPSGAGGHDRDANRLRALAAMHGYDGSLLGCREIGLRHGRRRVGVTPLLMLGAPAGTIGAAPTAAGARHGCDYVLAATTLARGERAPPAGRRPHRARPQHGRPHPGAARARAARHHPAAAAGVRRSLLRAMA